MEGGTIVIVCFLFPQFGIACERARLTQLWGQPLALTGAEGSVLAISEEAQRYGIRPGQTGVSARALCQTLVTLPYDRPAYETAAHCVWDLLAMESSFVEPVSPELCFIEMVGADTADRAGRIALALGERIRITVGVGLAKSKLLARQAAQLSREGRVEIIPLGLEDQASALIPIAQVGQIDARLCQEMHRPGRSARPPAARASTPLPAVQPAAGPPGARRRWRPRAAALAATARGAKDRFRGRSGG
jgi:nucleotidyltransferase/DNA polymerase involved in DNA repair